MDVRKYALDQVKRKGLVEGLLSVAQQTEVLKNCKRVAGGRCRALVSSSWKSRRLKLIGGQHAANFLYDPVDVEHDQLAQCRG
jgi:hypothetical protein